MIVLTYRIDTALQLNELNKRVADLEAQLAEARCQRESLSAPQPAQVAPEPSKHKKRSGERSS